MENDTSASLEDALKQLAKAPALLKEHAVAQVMARNSLQAELDIREKEIADLQTKATLAEEKLHNTELANELKEAIKQRELACEPLRKSLQNVTASSEKAKDTLPERLVGIVSQKAEILSRFTQNIASALTAQNEMTKTPEMIAVEQINSDKTVEQMLAELDLKIKKEKSKPDETSPTDEHE